MPESSADLKAPATGAPSTVKHAAIIMDGNRRWAKSRHLPTLMGHREGVEALKTLVRHCGEIKLEALTGYAFSTENWQRGAEEVGYLMKLFLEALAAELDGLHANNVCIRFIGDLDAFAPELRALIETSHAKTAANTGLKFQIAANYGGRQEIVSAARTLAESVKAGTLTPQDITEQALAAHLYTADLPDLDVLIRTGGEQRISNYLLWQAAYAELISVPELWPDFSPAVFDRCLGEVAQRERRYGA